MFELFICASSVLTVEPVHAGFCFSSTLGHTDIPFLVSNPDGTYSQPQVTANMYQCGYNPDGGQLMLGREKIKTITGNVIEEGQNNQEDKMIQCPEVNVYKFEIDFNQGNDRSPGNIQGCSPDLETVLFGKKQDDQNRKPGNALQHYRLPDGSIYITNIPSRVPPNAKVLSWEQLQTVIPTQPVSSRHTPSPPQP